jgi:large subunit ribosomal protein L23
MALTLKPIITEKTVRLAESQNAYTFEVPVRFNKISAAKELKKVFNVDAVKVNALVRPGKKVSFGRKRVQGQRSAKKVMVFTLAAGQKIEMFAQ